MHLLSRPTIAAFIACLLSACAAAEQDALSAAESIESAPSARADAQLPPTGTSAEIERWLAEGHYLRWACESAPHASRPPSGHSPNRVCSNALAHAQGAGEYPVGAASVKELYDDAGETIVGYAVAQKLGAGGAEAWHWYERLDGAGVVAIGKGDEGVPKRVCARCHTRAGATTFGHDAVFTQVQ